MFSINLHVYVRPHPPPPPSNIERTSFDYYEHMVESKEKAPFQVSYRAVGD